MQRDTSSTKLNALKLGKRAIQHRIESGDIDAVVRVARAKGASRIIRYLMRLLHDRREIIRWRAAVATGRVAAVMAEKDTEDVRELLRRVFWWMNDESGALLRFGPQVIAEVLVNVPELVDEYAGKLPHFLDEEPFERGTHWAIARIAREFPDAFDDVGELLRESLGADDPYYRAYAVMGLDALGDVEALSSLNGLRTDGAALRLYDAESDAVRNSTVGAVVGVYSGNR